MTRTHLSCHAADADFDSVDKKVSLRLVGVTVVRVAVARVAYAREKAPASERAPRSASGP